MPAAHFGDAVSLGAAQIEIWMAQARDPGATNYTIAQTLVLPATLDVDVFERALAATIDECDCLHVRFREGADGPLQIPGIAPAWHLERHEDPRARVAIDAALAAWLSRPFRIEDAALVRLALHRASDGAWVFVQAFHHIVIDGYGCALFAGRVAECYRALREGGSLPSRRVGRFTALLASDSAYRGSERMQEDRAFWRMRLAGLGKAAEVTDGGAGTTKAVEIVAGARATRWRAATTAAGVRLSHLFALVAHVLHATMRDEDDGIVALATAARSEADLLDVPGALANLVALRMTIAWDASWRRLLATMRDVVTEALAHQRFRIEDVRRALAAQGEQEPLAAVVVNCIPFYRPLRFDAVTASLRGCKYAPVESLAVFAYFHSEDPDIVLDFVRNREIRSAEDLDRFRRRFLDLCDRVADRLDQPASGLDLLIGEDRAKVAAWCGSPLPMAPETIPAAFRRVVASAPDATAVIFGAQRLSYRALHDRARSVAGRLRDLGVGPDEIVAVAIDRSDTLVVALLGILFAGGAYLALDLADPEDRLVDVLCRTGARCVVTAGDVPTVSDAAEKAGSRLVVLDDETELPNDAAEDAVPVLPDHAAYVCMTSGSTGQPKGVIVRHRDVVDLAAHERWRDAAQARVLVHSPVSFDASTYEIWTPLLNGHTCVVAPPGRLDAVAIGALVERHAVTALWLTAGLFHLVGDENPRALVGVSEILAGGDVLAPDMVAKVRAALPGTTVINGYGPTETTTFVSLHPVEDADDRRPVPLGRPLDGTRAYVLDRRMRLVPPGTPGELYVGGSGVARGYLMRPDLTAERFVASPFGPAGERLYRTGDRVVWSETGRLLFKGRMDGQIKLRGYRIEPAEIEAALAAEGVAPAVAMLHRSAGGHVSLVAYAVGEATEADGLRTRLAARLPGYMVPSAIVLLAAMPLTANGKVDRRRLPPPDLARRVTIEARTETEALIAGLFQDALDLASVDVDDNFFDDLGGSSLLAFRITGALRKTIGLPVAADAMFRAPTIALLASHVDGLGGRGPSAPPAKVARRSIAPQPALDVEALLTERFFDQPAGTKAFAAIVEPSGTRQILYAPEGVEHQDAEHATFPLGSISKFIASFLLCTMDQAGCLSVEDSVAARFGDLLPLPSPVWQQTTFADLATHTSGLPTFVPALEQADEEATRRFLRSFEGPLDAKTYRYCTFGIGLLGQALRAGEAGSYLDVLARYVLQPLRMTATGSLPVPGNDDRFRFYECSRDMRSSIADLQRLMIGLLAEARDWPQAALARMLSVARPTGMPDLDMTLGLRSRRSHGAHLLYHGGGGDGYRAFFGLAPDARRGIVLLTNREIHIGDIGQHWLCPAYPLAAPAAARRKVMAQA